MGLRQSKLQNLDRIWNGFDTRPAEGNIERLAKMRWHHGKEDALDDPAFRLGFVAKVLFPSPVVVFVDRH
jgi:hypothetical protein